MIRNPGSFNNLNTQINNILKELNKLAEPGYAWTLIDTIYYQKDINWLYKPIHISKDAIGFKCYAFYSGVESNLPQIPNPANTYEFTTYKNAKDLGVGDLLLDRQGTNTPEINLKVISNKSYDEIGKNIILCQYVFITNYTDNIQAFFQLIPIEKKKLQLINRINFEVFKHAS